MRAYVNSRGKRTVCACVRACARERECITIFLYSLALLHTPDVVKRFTVGSRWRTKNLTYKISKYPTGLNKQEVDKEIANAFGVWSGETDLTFTRKTGHENVRMQCTIEIYSLTHQHDTGNIF